MFKLVLFQTDLGEMLKQKLSLIFIQLTWNGKLGIKIIQAKTSGDRDQLCSGESVQEGEVWEDFCTVSVVIIQKW